MWVSLRRRAGVYRPCRSFVEIRTRHARCQSERPWDEAKRKHWFCPRLEGPPRILGRDARRFVVQPAGAGHAVVHDERHDRVIPTGDPTLWVLAFGVMLALVSISPADRALQAGRRDRRKH
jgi:hypothetical protein